jgi:hypothetical protein
VSPLFVTGERRDNPTESVPDDIEIGDYADENTGPFPVPRPKGDDEFFFWIKIKYSTVALSVKTTKLPVVSQFEICSAVFRFVETREGVYETRSPVPLIRAFQDRYGFVEVPTKLAEMNLQTGVSFRQGYFRGKVIDKFQIYANGLLCESQNDNELSDSFLDEVFIWAAQQHDITLNETARAYEVAASVNLGGIFKKFASVGELIASLLKAYRQQADSYQVSGLKLHYDVSDKVASRAPEFVFERRAEEPYAQNLYFTSAPLRTIDHLQVLEVLERTFA